jgi:ribonuclease BN (tRNA processing enzyme)
MRLGVVVGCGIGVLLALARAGAYLDHSQPAAAASGTQVVLLGTGSPRPEPERSGPCTAIVVNGVGYLVDVGPGVVRRAEAAFEKGITALAPDKLQTLFVTHLHSDHTVGYPDLIFTTWVQGRRLPLRVYGPTGVEAMTRHILMAWQADIDVRTKGAEQRNPAGIAIEAHDVVAGRIYQDANVTVTAFQNAHGDVVPLSFGYRFQSADRTIVISGDTSPSTALIESCQKCDVLIHEAYSEAYTPADVSNWVQYRSRFHTTTAQLADIANKTQPKLLILYHRGIGPKGREISDQQYLSEVGRTYKGKVVVGHDLDIY